MKQLRQISTHTLTWSVTHDADSIKEFLLNFNSHAHVERDPEIRKTGLKTFYFNSHAHVERDLGHGWRFWCNLYFNSHAHVERDSNDSYLIPVPSDFNSHAHVERDSERYQSAYAGNKFQLTRSRGAWPCRKQESGTLINFNSHAHVERDVIIVYHVIY